MIENKGFAKAIKNSLSVFDAATQLGVSYNTVKRYINKSKFDISHFIPGGKTTLNKKKKEFRQCKVCNKTFEVVISNKKSANRVVCSKSCSNIYFPRTTAKNFNVICFKHHKRQCCVCGESRVVCAHHYDLNHKNNDPKNLIPLCPTCHVCCHTIKWNKDVQPKIDLYYKIYSRVV